MLIPAYQTQLKAELAAKTVDGHADHRAIEDDGANGILDAALVTRNHEQDDIPSGHHGQDDENVHNGPNQGVL